MNAINVIYPYRCQGMWVFDDDRVGLLQEPFVGGADTVIEQAVAAKGIVNPAAGFRLIFSSSPFPNYDLQFNWLRAGDGGNWYFLDAFKMEAWLCPALFKYFEKAPKELYAKFEAKS